MIEIKCPNCGLNNNIPRSSLGVTVGCVNCRHIYNMSPQIQKNYDRQILTLIAVLLLIVCGIIFFKLEYDHRFVGRGLLAAKNAVNDRFAKSEKKTVNNENFLTFTEFDSSYATKVQRKKWKAPRILPEHKGRQVQWSGEVVEIGVDEKSLYGNYFVKFRHLHSSDSDVTVYFNDLQGQSLTGLKAGFTVNYTAEIVSSGYANKNHTLKRGQILK